MNKRLSNFALLFFSIAIAVYVSEYLLGFYLTKSLPRYPLPPYSEQQHATVDYKARYRYNNVSLRSMDYDPKIAYDAIFLGDSFFFGQGVSEGRTFFSLLQQKGYKVLNASEIATNPLDYFHKLRILQSHRLTTKKIIIGLCMGNDFQDIADKKVAEAIDYVYRTEFLHYGPLQFMTLERLRYQLEKKRLKIGDWLQCRFSNQSCTETAVVHKFEHRKRFFADWLQFFTDNRPELMRAMLGSAEKPSIRAGISEAEYLKMIQYSDDSLKHTVSILNAVREVSGSVPVYIVLIPGPHFVMGFRSPGYDLFVARLKESLDPAVSVVDLHGIMTPAMHFPNDGHWNEEGHRFIAALLEKSALPLRE